MQYLLCSLVALAGLSPLLTFARLFQLKEWRIDRLREHLRREGWLRQIFGLVRPCIVALGILGFIVFYFIPATMEWANVILWSTWGILAWFSLFQFVLGRQMHPVWTAKAILLSTLAFILFLGTAFTLCLWDDVFLFALILTLLPLGAFLFVFLAWFLLLPLDRLLKKSLLRRAARMRAKLPNLAVIGITGSVGKTTTKELLAHLLNDRKILVTPAHVNTEMGVADLMIRKLTEEAQIFIVEMGAYRRGEIARLCLLVQPHIGVITYVGKQHLGLFGSEDDVVAAKGELFAALPAQGHALLNADSGHADELMKRASCPVRTVGTGGHATYEAFEIVEQTEGVAFTLRATKFLVPLQGTHQVTNVLLAVAVAEVLGVPLAESAKRLKTFHPLAQTFERKEGASGQIVLDDTHNASPESFRAGLEWARLHPAKKKLLVTAGLLELGKQEKSIHQELGLLSRGIYDEVIFLNKNCAQYFEQGFGRPIRVFPRGKFSLKIEPGMLIVCEGRMGESVVAQLLS